MNGYIAFLIVTQKISMACEALQLNHFMEKLFKVIQLTNWSFSWLPEIDIIINIQQQQIRLQSVAYNTVNIKPVTPKQTKFQYTSCSYCQGEASWAMLFTLNLSCLTISGLVAVLAHSDWLLPPA